MAFTTPALFSMLGNYMESKHYLSLVPALKSLHQDIGDQSKYARKEQDEYLSSCNPHKASPRCSKSISDEVFLYLYGL